jgi:NADH dehydrogenase
MTQSSKKRVVIVGGGYGGVTLARNLRKAGLEVFLIDKTNYHQFQPLFYQVATAGLEAISISFPFRKMLQNFSNFHFRLAELLKVDAALNQIITSIGNIRFDFLVIATGTDNNFYGNQNIEKYSYPLKSVSEAIDLRNKILQNNEDAICVRDKDTRRGMLSIAIVGGGPTGIEMAGALSELRIHVLPKDYPEIDFSEMEIFLFDSSARLLKAMSPISSERTEKYLKKLGVKIMLNSRIKDYDGRILSLLSGEKFSVNTLVWAAGVTGKKIEGLNEDVFCRGNRIRTDSYNRISGYENIFAIGDISYYCDECYPDGQPQLAEVAIQQAKNLAENLRRMSNGRSLKEFRYRDVGVMAVIGRNLAVADLPRFKFGGTIAWYIFMFWHLMSILVVKNRFSTFLHWAFKYYTYDKSLRLIIDNRKLKHD